MLIPPNKDEPKKSLLSELIQQHREKKETPPSAPAGGGAPPAAQNIEKRLADLEGDLWKEKERALAAELRLKERESLQAQMEGMLKDLQGRQTSDLRLRETAQAKAEAEDRVESLEGKLHQLQEKLDEFVSGDQVRALEQEKVLALQKAQELSLSLKELEGRLAVSEKERAMEKQMADENRARFAGDLEKLRIEKEGLLRLWDENAGLGELMDSMKKEVLQVLQQQSPRETDQKVLLAIESVGHRLAELAGQQTQIQARQEALRQEGLQSAGLREEVALKASALKGELEQERKRVSVLAAELEKKSRDLDAAAEDLEKKGQALKFEEERRRQETAEREARLADLREKCAVSAVAVQEKENLIALLRSNLAAAEEQHRQSPGFRMSMAEREEAAQARAKLAAQVAGLQRELDEERRLLDTLKEELERKREDLVVGEERWRLEIERRDAEIAGLQKKLEIMSAAIQEKEVLITKLNADISHIEDDRRIAESLKESLAVRDTQIQDLLRRLHDNSSY